MRKSAHVLVAAAAAALGWPSIASAAETGASTTGTPVQSVPAGAVAAAQATGRTPGLLTRVFDPSDSLYKQTGIEIYGHVQVGWTHNFDDPSTGQNAFRSFDFEHDEPTLHQVSLTIEKRVDYRRNKFDIGGAMEWMYGADAGLIHANGIFDWYDGPRDPENQFDPVQFYADLSLPVLNGARLRVGKFVNLVGFESINPTADFIGFYSRSFVFGSGYPFTHMGALLTFDLDPARKVTLTGGITRGDEQGFKDSNDAWSFLGSLNIVLNDRMAIYIANSTGPEQPGNDSDYRTTWDATFFWKPTDKCRFLANGYFLYDNAGAADGGSGYLYSFAVLGSYDVNKYLTFKARAEFFHDEDGVRTLPDLDLFEVTVGVDIKPFAGHRDLGSLVIRPELRFDYSHDDVFDGENNQITFGIDAIFRM